ncbi:MAG: phosphoenolpyruvate carboxykinase (GTP) [Planctomycetaceae bacterium]
MASALETWIDSVARQTRPDRVVWCDGSDDEFRRMTEAMVADGTLVRLNEQAHPNSFLHRSDPHDVARVEDRTFICSRYGSDAGPTNNWLDPAAMHARLDVLFAGCMRGRTMYVLPYLMGSPGSPLAKVGVELTDSPYVAANMRIMTRMGRIALDALGGRDDFTRGVHSKGRLDPAERIIAHFPDENLIRSFSSNYGGNALLGKKCHALRLASVQARNEGWLAEHMLILGITDPQGRKTWVCAAFPSACGKTNLAMLIPPPEMTAEGWKVETVGDDIAWLKYGEDGRLYAVNPEHGFFGVAPGTSERTNPNALASCRANTIFTNVALRPDGTVWWEGLSDSPAQCIDWIGNDWTPDSGRPAAHPNSRFTAPVAQCPSLSSEYENPRGVPIDAIIFGGRRMSVMPLVFEAFDWNYGVYAGATMTSEKTAAATGTVGEVRFDPMAMLPFCGYHMADYWRHWLNVGHLAGMTPPRVYQVNWFRKGSDGKYLWPGFGQNLRVLKWIAARCRGEADAVESPIGLLPTSGAIDFDAVNVSDAAVRQLFAIDPVEWLDETDRREMFLARFKERLPPELSEANDGVRRRLHTQRVAERE